MSSQIFLNSTFIQKIVCNRYILKMEDENTV